ATYSARSPVKMCLVRLGLAPNASYSLLLPGVLTPSYPYSCRGEGAVAIVCEGAGAGAERDWMPITPKPGPLILCRFTSFGRPYRREEAYFETHIEDKPQKWTILEPWATLGFE